MNSAAEGPAFEQVLGDELIVAHRDVQRRILDAVIVVAGHHQVDLDVRRDRDRRLVGLDKPGRGRPIGDGDDVVNDRVRVELVARRPEVDLVGSGLRHLETAGQDRRIIGGDFHRRGFIIGDVNGRQARRHVGLGMNGDRSFPRSPRHFPPPQLICGGTFVYSGKLRSSAIDVIVGAGKTSR